MVRIESLGDSELAERWDGHLPQEDEGGRQQYLWHGYGLPQRPQLLLEPFCIRQRYSCRAPMHCIMQ